MLPFTNEFLTSQEVLSYLNDHSGLRSASDIASYCETTKMNVVSILGKLVKANIVIGRKGPSGGYVLARQLASVTVKDIYDALSKKKSAWEFTGNTAIDSKYKELLNTKLM